MEDHVRIIDKNQKVGPAHIICEFCGRLEAGNQNILQQNLLTTHVIAMVFFIFAREMTDQSVGFVNKIF